MGRFALLILAAVLAGGCADQKKDTSPTAPNPDQFDKPKTPAGPKVAPPKSGSRAG